MQIEPGRGISGLSFGASREQALAFFGAARVGSYDHGDGRKGESLEEWGGEGEGPDLLFQDDEGLIAITLFAGPAILFGFDLFAVTPERLEQELRARGHVPLVEESAEVGLSWTFEDLGLIVYLEEGQVVVVEIMQGRWWKGKRVTS